MMQFRLGNPTFSTKRGLTVFLITFLTLSSFTFVEPRRALADSFEHTTVASGFSSPTSMAFSPDGRLFVAEQGGTLRVIKNGVLLSTPFVTLPVNSGGERGLLGVAFDPDYVTNHYIYVYYTDGSTLRHRISRFTSDPTNHDVALPGSEIMLLDLEASAEGWHNGGALHFGPDGKLYVGIGDGDNTSNSQDKMSLSGKLLRINSDGSIPADNPFVGDPNARGEIYAYGLRNPFTFAINQSNGDVYVNDVGGGIREEVNLIIPGGNYGWPECEGLCTNPAFEDPVYAYAPNMNGTCAITGGTFYNEQHFPMEYRGEYFFADFCANWIKMLNPDFTTTDFWDPTSPFVVDIDVGPEDGNIYYLARNGWATGVGRVEKITYVPDSGNQTPVAIIAATPTSGQPPLTVEFDGTGSTDPEGDTLAHNWDFGDNSTGFGPSISHTYTTSGTYTAVLTVSDSQGLVGTESIQITVGSPPTADITTPTVGATYHGGNTINFSGSASDPEEGNLPDSAFSWTIIFHHDTHTHPFLGPINGVRNGSFTIPQTGHQDTDVWYRINLTVTDGDGVSTTTYRDVHPEVRDLTINTDPTGLTVNLDGQPVTTPHTVPTVVGMIRSITAPSPQTLSGTTHNFVSWSDSGAQTHEILMPNVDTAYTAAYQAQSSQGALTDRNTLALNGWRSNGIFSVPFTTTGTDRVLLVSARITQGLVNGNINVTATYGGVPMEVIAISPILSVFSEPQILWGLKNPPLGTNNLVIDRISSGDINVTAGVVSYAGVDQTTPWHNLQNVSSTDPNASVTLSTNSNEEIFGGVTASSMSISSITSGADQTVVSPYVASSGRGHMSTTEPGGLSAIHSYTISPSMEWRIMTVAIKPLEQTDIQAPSVPQDLQVSGITHSQVTLAWDDSTDNVGVTGYRIYRNGTFLDTSASTSFIDSALNDSTTYLYEVSAVDAAGLESGKSASLSVTTNSAPDTTAPSVPQDLSATSVSHNEVTLEWTASTDDTGVTGYRIYRNNSLVATTTQLTYTDSGLTPSTAYNFEVSAVDLAGNESVRASVGVVTDAPLAVTRIEVTPLNPTINPGDNLQFTALAYDQNDEPIEAVFTWSSERTVDITSNGLLSTKLQFIVTATSGGVNGTTTVTFN